MLVMGNQSMLVTTQEHRFFKIYPIFLESMLVMTQEHRFYGTVVLRGWNKKYIRSAYIFYMIYFFI